MLAQLLLDWLDTLRHPLVGEAVTEDVLCGRTSASAAARNSAPLLNVQHAASLACVLSLLRFLFQGLSTCGTRRSTGNGDNGGCYPTESPPPSIVLEADDEMPLESSLRSRVLALPSKRSPRFLA